jgi:hypothetical protein
MNAALRTARAFRTAAICLLIIVSSGGIPAVGSCVEEILGCSSVCLRCACKHSSDTIHLRASCPCCERHAPATNPMSGQTPAILPLDAPSLFIPPARQRTPAPIQGGRPFFLPIPHPPPRTLPPA